MHQNAFGGRAPPGPAGELMPSPRPQAAIRGPTSKEEGGEESDGMGRGKEERNGEGKIWGVHLDLLTDDLTV